MIFALPNRKPRRSNATKPGLLATNETCSVLASTDEIIRGEFAIAATTMTA